MTRARRPSAGARRLAPAVRGGGGQIVVTLAVLAGLAIAMLWTTAITLAGSPTPSSAAGDPRSSGQGPGLVGDPLEAIALVAAIGLASLLATVAYVRLTNGTRGSRPGR